MTGARDGRNERDDVTGDGGTGAPLSGAERSRRYRDRKRGEHQARKAGSGLTKTGEWVAQFPGQREPFQAGHELSTVHGAYSQRRVSEVAAQFRAALLGSAGTPGYLREERFGFALDSWARAEAIVSLLARWVDQHDVEELLSELTEADEDEDRAAPGTVRRKLRQRTRASALMALARWEGRASSARKALGLDPQAFAELSKNVALMGKAVDDQLGTAAAKGREIRERRQAQLRVIGGAAPADPALPAGG